MDKRALGALIALNAVLLVALLATTLAPQPAVAQGLGRREYLMVAGDVNGRRQQAAVYIIDVSTSRMATILFNSGDRKLEVMAGRSLMEDLQQAEADRP